jgi:adenylyltransferase/sulfurtransferase
MKGMKTRDAFESYRALAGERWSEETVRSLFVIVLGCGALGSWLAEMLAAMGVKSIALIDDDVVQPHNRLRMALVSADDVGRAKVDAVADGLCRRFGDVTHVVPLSGNVQTTLGHGLARRAACVFLCTDNRAARLRGCQSARRARTPHLSGAIDEFFGMVSGVFVPPQSACYECTLTERERKELMPLRFSCAPQPDERAPSVPTTPIAASITAAWMTHLFLRHAHGEQDVIGQRIFLNPLRHVVRVAEFPRRPDCTCAGETVADVIALDAARDEITPRQLLRKAESLCGADACVMLDDALVMEEICPQCGTWRRLTPPRPAAAPSSCPHCDAPMMPLAQTSLLTAEDALAHFTFAELGLPPLPAVLVRGSNGARTFELSGDARRLGLTEEMMADVV